MFVINVHVVGKFFGSNNRFIFMVGLQFQIATDEVNLVLWAIHTKQS